MPATHFRAMQKYCACHAKRLLTRYETCWNVTKCHACHAKRGYATSETSKSDHSCKTHPRHSHSDLTRTVANGCGQLRTFTNGCGRKRNVERTHPFYAFRKKDPAPGQRMGPNLKSLTVLQVGLNFNAACLSVTAGSPMNLKFRMQAPIRME